VFDATVIVTAFQTTLFAAAAGHPGWFAAVLALALGACLAGVNAVGEARNEGD
jgi:hypothetical protein